MGQRNAGVVRVWKMTFFWIGMGLVFCIGCNNHSDAVVASVSDDVRVVEASFAKDASPTLFLDDESHESLLADFFQRPDAYALANRCCSSFGRMDECWWRDAIADGVTCQTDADCVYDVVGACVKEEYGPGNLGVCRCRPEVMTDCFDLANGKDGVCITDPANPESGMSLCGPSFCNGYFTCSCDGGCEWWDTNDRSNTPQQVAQRESGSTGASVYCCEGNYPWGGNAIVTFYSVDTCIPEGSMACVTDAECDDGNPCTRDICTISNSCAYLPMADNTVCGVDTNPSDCVGPDVCVSGVCERGLNYLPEGTWCGAGADTTPDNCIVGFQCDRQANCRETYAHPGTPCALDEDAFPSSCWQGVCGSVSKPGKFFKIANDVSDGVCHEIKRRSPMHSSCAGGGFLAGDMGSFSNAETGVLSISGATTCAGDASTAAAAGCVTPSGMFFGAGAKDVVHSFGYTTTNAVQHQLYGFVVTLTADFQAVLYAQTDECTDGAVKGHSCQWHPELGNGGPPAPYEYAANNQGRDWQGNDQRCSLDGATGYQWCRRSFEWTYPEAVTNCGHNLDGGLVCHRTAPYVAQTFIYPINDESATHHRVYIHVDGATAPDEGNYTLHVERVKWQNGQCERMLDGPRVYDITDVSSDRVYLGNLKGVANSDHSTGSSACGGYECGAFWGGKNRRHGIQKATPFWPNAAYFRIAPNKDTQYCIQTDHVDVPHAVHPVLEVRKLDNVPLNNRNDLCQGRWSPVMNADAAEGPLGIQFEARANETYLVLLSEKRPAAGPCQDHCNYRLMVYEGKCRAPDVLMVSPSSITSFQDSCVPNGCEDAPVRSTIDLTGHFSGCVFVPENPALHLASWNWRPDRLESIAVNGTPLASGDLWLPGELPVTCNDGWYLDIVFNHLSSHLEVKP
ncbi:MAG: hypothetical protein JXR76_05765 [Deltaproteobacteria bacterium]|nr:hypothetical protein [Deltaproteobacteria bacterium]